MGVGPRAAPVLSAPLPTLLPPPTDPPYPLSKAPGVSSPSQEAPGPPIPLLPGFTASWVGTPIPLSHPYLLEEGG